MSRTMRWSATVLVLACLTAGAAQAWPLAQSRTEFAAPDLGSRLEAAWDWLVSLFRPVESKPDQVPSDPLQKDACSIDPIGRLISCN